MSVCGSVNACLYLTINNEAIYYAMLDERMSGRETAVICHQWRRQYRGQGAGGGVSVRLINNTNVTCVCVCVCNGKLIYRNLYIACVSVSVCIVVTWVNFPEAYAKIYYVYTPPPVTDTHASPTSIMFNEFYTC